MRKYLFCSIMFVLFNQFFSTAQVVNLNLVYNHIENKNINLQVNSSIIEERENVSFSSSKTSTFSDYYDRATSYEVPALQATPTANYYYLSSVGAVGLVGVDYDNATTVQVDEFLVLFAAKVQKVGTRIFKAYIYTAGTNGLPSGDPLDSTTYTFANINAPLNPDSSALALLNSTFNFTSIQFPSPVTITGNFVAVVQIDDKVASSSPDDVVYLYTNNCNGDGNNENRICHYPVPGLQKLSGGSMAKQWYTANNFWPTMHPVFNKNFNCDAMIIPIVQGEAHTLSTNTIKGKVNGLTFLGHYPSPAIDQIKINYELANRSAVVNLRVFDITGKTVYETHAIEAGAGKHCFDLDIQLFAAGNLYYTLTTDDGKISSRFTVVK